MPLVAAKCTECGGTVKVDTEKKAAVCEYCNNAFIIEEAINHFNTNYFNTTNISNSVVHIHEEKNKDFVIEAGVLKKYRGETREVAIPDSVVEIGWQAFENLNITRVKIPNSVTKIGYCAFNQCKKLNKISIPSSIKEIDRQAFGFCEELEEIIFSEGLEIIGQSAFVGCVKLTKVAIPDSVKTLGNGIFSNCSQLKTVIISPKLIENLNTAKLVFEGTPFGYQIKEKLEEQQQAKWQNEGLCKFCGGILSTEMKSWGKCKSCGTPDKWFSKGLCRFCGGKMSFLGKCKFCGKENYKK